ncbi:MAG: hypothetical protein AAF984_09785 [Verrucomicrobiota bacterium]
MSEENKTPQRYSSFWPLLVIVLAFNLMIIFQAVDMLKQRAFLKQNVQKLQPSFNKAQIVSNTMASISRELVVLQDQSSEAEKIVKDFQIRLNIQQQQDNSQ